jgi:hypothetical protein
MSEPNPVVRDPGLHFGRFRPLERTDGLYIVYDPMLPPARKTVEGQTFKTLADAVTFAKECFSRDKRPEE